MTKNNTAKPDFSIKSYLLPKIAPEGVEIFAIAVVSALLLSLLSNGLGMIAFAFAICSYYFFRDPERYTPDTKGAVISPADGRVLFVKKADYPKELGVKGEAVKISIFMSVFDVHVNRNPVSGKVAKVVYVPGKFIHANLDKASEDNERSLTLIDADGGDKVAYVQIAGLVARRIVNNLKEGAKVETGDRFGLIKFGSRLDVYLPAGKYDVKVMAGQKMVAGETILATRKK
ncbi:MAG: phosphatidylserine decarboxylase [Alphaproteobacteria bacterium]|nr:phosphatidylserine decarboxylase [Alphaproteobacteria bacterium]